MESWMEKIYEVELSIVCLWRRIDWTAARWASRIRAFYASLGKKRASSWWKRNASFARARLLEVLEPSPQRITPRCAHFGLCGGCHYQHLPYPAQLAAKTAILRDQLERLGGLKAPPIQPTVASPQQYQYRNHVQFHLTRQGSWVTTSRARTRCLPSRSVICPSRA